MCEYIKDFFIGTIAGIVSSLIVSFIWNQIVKNIEKRNEDKKLCKQFEELFFHDIQLVCRYLDRLQLELGFPDSEEKRQEILRLLDNQPMTSSFKHGMNDEGQKILLKIHTIKHEIETNAKKNELSLPICMVKSSELFKLEVELLKSQHNIKKTWNEYKESIK